MPGTVLILAPSDDVHALAVKARIEQMSNNCACALIVDARTFPLASTITWNWNVAQELTAELTLSRALPANSGAASDARKLSGSKVTLRLEDIISIWVRRPADVGIDPRITIPEFRDYASLATRSSLTPVFSIRPTYNSLSVETRLKWKPLQLYHASRFGFRTPRTLVTSSPEEAIDFISELSRQGKETIYKQVISTPDGPPTRVFSSADMQRIQDIALCPNLFQERIEGGPDLRVMVIRDRVFACEWRREHQQQPVVDIRLDPEATMWPTDLSDEFSARIVELHQRLGLALGVYDFKVNAEGIPYFLEVNSGGQWLDLEAEAGHPISWFVAKLLVDPEGIDCNFSKPFTVSELNELLLTSESCVGAGIGARQ